MEDLVKSFTPTLASEQDFTEAAKYQAQNYDDDDDFGEFLSVPATEQETAYSPAVYDTITVIEPSVVLGHELLDYINLHILTLPETFFGELGNVSHGVRKRILNDERTKTWVRGVIMAAMVAERIARGRNRRNDRRPEHREKMKFAMNRLYSQWIKIVPRLISLSFGKLRLKSLVDTAWNISFVPEETCKVCFGEEDDYESLKHLEGSFGHPSCIRLHSKIQATFR